MSLTERQAELIDTHRAIQRDDLPFVLVGGWAVSAFQTRFTTDVDMVIPETAVEAYDGLLRERGYTKEFDSDIANIYDGRIVRYETAVGENTANLMHSSMHSDVGKPMLSGRIATFPNTA